MRREVRCAACRAAASHRETQPGLRDIHTPHPCVASVVFLLRIRNSSVSDDFPLLPRLTAPTRLVGMGLTHSCLCAAPDATPPTIELYLAAPIEHNGVGFLRTRKSLQTRTRTNTHTQKHPHTHMHTHTHTHAHAHTHTHSRTPTRTHTRTHTNTHTYLHTHAHATAHMWTSRINIHALPLEMGEGVLGGHTRARRARGKLRPGELRLARTAR